mgnify:CR=1 FL=1
MTCSKNAACLREFRLTRGQRDAVLNRAFQLDMNSPKSDIRGAYPYRWSIREATTIVHHYSSVEQHWYLLTEDDGIPGIGVHIMVFNVREGGRLVNNVDVHKYELAEALFKLELLQLPGAYTVQLDSLAQERELLRQEMDEATLPEPWKPSPSSL